jgi:hypothetical protein
LPCESLASCHYLAMVPYFGRCRPSRSSILTLANVSTCLDSTVHWSPFPPAPHRKPVRVRLVSNVWNVAIPKILEQHLLPGGGSTTTCTSGIWHLNHSAGLTLSMNVLLIQPSIGLVLKNSVVKKERRGSEAEIMQERYRSIV